MKKLFLISTASLMFLASCTNESVVDSDIISGGNKIAFNTYSNATKGNPFDTNLEFKSKDNAFGVTAFISTQTTPYLGAITLGAKISSDGSTWNYANPNDIRFWPVNNETLDFYAYAPFTNPNNVAPAFSKTDGLKFTNYTVPSEESNQLDFMYASALNKGKPANGTSVNMHFKHALTQVHFKARTEADNMYVDLDENGIKIHNIKSKGNFQLNNNGEASWSDPNSKVDYTVTSSAMTIARGVGNMPFTGITTDNNALMLMPQSFVAWIPAFNIDGTPNTAGNTITENDADGGPKNAYLSILCKIYTKDKDNKTVYLKGDNDNFATIYVPISSRHTLSNDEIWNMGNKITYNLVFGGGYDEGGEVVLDPITFTTTIENWDSFQGSDVNF